MRRVEAIRKQGGVRPMLTEENELPLGELPDGIYGFTVPWAIEPYRTTRSSYDHLTLSSEGGGTAVVELHKQPRGGAVKERGTSRQVARNGPGSSPIGGSRVLVVPGRCPGRPIGRSVGSC